VEPSFAQLLMLYDALLLPLLVTGDRAVQGTHERLVAHQQSPAHFLISNIFNNIRLVRRREEPRSKFAKARETEDACKCLLEQLHWVFVSKPLSKA
jgi:hypothetical protein